MKTIEELSFDLSLEMAAKKDDIIRASYAKYLGREIDEYDKGHIQLRVDPNGITECFYDSTKIVTLFPVETDFSNGDFKATVKYQVHV